VSGKVVAGLWLALGVAGLTFLPWWCWLLGAALLVAPTVRAARARRSEGWRPTPRKRDSAEH
jgi:hypothetical protein